MVTLFQVLDRIASLTVGLSRPGCSYYPLIYLTKVPHSSVRIVNKCSNLFIPASPLSTQHQGVFLRDTALRFYRNALRRIGRIDKFCNTGIYTTM